METSPVSRAPLTDGLSNGYLSMVVVAAPFRGRGIGRALVERIVGAEENVTLGPARRQEGAPAFFARLGFAPSARDRLTGRPSTTLRKAGHS
jgi:GNAT superfamily N-acetyltransferase